MAPTPPKKSSAGKIIAIIGGLLVVAIIALIAVVVIARGSDTKADDVTVRTNEDTDGRAPQPEPDKSMKEDAPDATGAVDIVGPTSGVENQIASAAIVDIEAYWAEEFPVLTGADYEPVSGGFFSWSPDEELPPCAESSDGIAGNAFYCGDGDVVAWDDTGLIPDLYQKYGDLSVATVFAHEWGHAIQARIGAQGSTVTLEQQADCFAGSWVKNVQENGSDYFVVDGPALDQALAGFIEIADAPGTSALDENAHGSAFDRINSFQEGLTDGADACLNYSDETVGPRLVQLEFETQEDLDSGGNAAYADILEWTTLDLEDYWSIVADQVYGTTWTPLSAAVPFDGTEDDTPECGGSDTSGYTLFYCVDGAFVAYDDIGLFPEVYDALGDFAVAALYGSQYSLAAQDQLGIAPKDARDQNLMADCMTGSWAASVFLQNRPDTGSLSLSPGDFDEAVKVLLALGSTEDDGGTQGTGFERVSAFRTGVLNGVSACEQ